MKFILVKIVMFVKNCEVNLMESIESNGLGGGLCYTTLPI
jgi:hypothetical protein